MVDHIMSALIILLVYGTQCTEHISSDDWDFFNYIFYKYILESYILKSQTILTILSKNLVSFSSLSIMINPGLNKLLILKFSVLAFCFQHI